MRVLIVMVLATALMSVSSAQKMDLASVTCNQLLNTDKQNVVYLVVWLRGFWTEADEPMILDLERLQADADRVTAFCIKNPDTRLFSAADQIFQQ